VLVYDGRKQAFRSAVDLLTCGVEDLLAAPWESESVQAFLEAQFRGRPFVFCLIDATAVHVGEAAVRRALEARGIAPPVARGFERLYPLIAAPFGRVVHGEPRPTSTARFGSNRMRSRTSTRSGSNTPDNASLCGP